MAFEPFKAAPVRPASRWAKPRRSATVVPLRPTLRLARRQGRWSRGFVATLVILPLAAFGAVFAWGGPPLAEAVESRLPSPVTLDRETARFGRCEGPVRVNCVVDGDTFWYRGEKIRIADINTPELSEPECPAEARLAARATDRLQALLNQGAFSLEEIDRDRDQYGRLLRTVTRDGRSVGAVLVREELAERWKGYRGSWC